MSGHRLTPVCVPPAPQRSAVYKEAGFPHEVVSDLTCRKWQVRLLAGRG